MATARVATGSVLDTVTATANCLSTTVQTVGKSIEMLGRYVDKAAEQQRLQYKADMKTFKQRLAEESVLETQKRRVEITKWLAANPNCKAEYETELAEMIQLLEEDDKNVSA